MTIERTELANRAYRSIVNAQHPMEVLGKQMVDAITQGNEEEVARIKDAVHATQTWRNR
jgi:hypothetical protein